MTLTDLALAAWHENAVTLAAGPQGGTLSVEAADMLELIERLRLAEAVCNAMTAMDVRLLDYDAAIAYESFRAARSDAAGSDEEGAS